MNDIIDLTGSDGEEESKSIETTLKQIPQYIHDGYAVEYADNDIDRIMSNIRHSLSLCFSWLLVSLASTSFCSLASTDFSSGLTSTGFFGFVLSGVLQKSFALYYFNENVSTGTMQMQNVIPNICLNKFSRKQLDMVVQ